MKRLAVILSLALLAANKTLAEPATIVCPADAPANVKLAAKEVRRYVYLRTGELATIENHRTYSNDRTYISLTVDPVLGAQEYRLKSAGQSLAISGGSDVAVLYGAYAFAEKLGVRFELNGDVLPDGRIPLQMPRLDETRKPLFELRGLQPFHDFPEGPDWWTQDDWRLFLGQAVKMRMNFVGLHTYPFHNKDLGPEPLVWVGLPEDVNADGTVKRSDEASWYTTAKFMPYGCYAPAKTGDYGFGAAMVFPADNYGPEINGPDDFPMPKTPEARAAMINRTGAMLKPVFAEARQRGMKIAIGTEVPLDIPDGVMEQLKAKGMDPKDPATLRKLYEGMFSRIQRTFPVDYYWQWGHEGEIDEKRVAENILQAHAALQDAKAQFSLAVCGWGWTAGHFPSLDKILPREIAFSAINGSAGHAPVSENFGRIGDRSRWAIPWVEDDSVLTSIQIRAGRLRRDAVDARRHGCTGLMGIFWRTRILSPNLAALAQAGWEQGEWSTPPRKDGGKSVVEVSGGQTVAFLNDRVKGADPEPIYQTIRYGMSGYRFAVPDGTYSVTLHFVEPAYKEAGKRIFGVRLQGRQVIEHLDIFAKVGQFAAIKMPFDGIAVTGGVLKIDFTSETEYPIIAAIEVSGNGISRKVNCGGQAYQDFTADASSEKQPRDLPTADLYQDWAAAQFGPDAGPEAAAIFTKLDGNFPATSGWIRGPGAIAVQNAPWAAHSKNFAFVELFAALRPKVKGAGCLERFDFWLNSFRTTRAMGEFACARGELNRIMQAIAKEKDPAVQRQLAKEQALPVRLRMAALAGDKVNAVLASLTNATELGTLCNIEQQSMVRLKLLKGHDAALEKILGEPLPAAAQPWQDYRGGSRLVVMNGRTALVKGEAQTLRIIALDKQPVKSIVVKCRPFGKGDWQSIEAKHVARAVWGATLPAAAEDFEYHVVAETADGKKLAWPATAPEMNQTVVVTE
jgi:hypothetical protein